MVGNRGALGLGHHATLGCGPAITRSIDSSTSSIEITERWRRAQQRRLVEQICQIRAGEANGHLGELLKLYVLVHRLVLGMHAQDLLAALHIRTVDRNLTVKTTGT